MAKDEDLPRSTHEDLLRFILGPDYRRYVEGTRLAGRPVVRHLRGRYTAPQLVLMLLGTILGTMALIFTLLPQSLFLLGFIKTPTPLAAAGPKPSAGVAAVTLGSLSLETSVTTTVEWFEGDYRQALTYTLRNRGRLYSYPTVTVVLVDSRGVPLNKLSFGMPAGALPPGKTLAGRFYWGRTAADMRATGYLLSLSAAEETTGNAYVAPDTTKASGSAGSGLATAPGAAAPATPSLPETRPH